MNSEFKKYLGIDWGMVRIGLALGDSETGLATPYKTIASGKEVLDVVLEEGIDEIIVGKPTKMSGEEKYLDEFNDFVEDLKNDLAIPVILVDERLSSKAADALIGTKKTKASRDEISAMIILQNYLDRI
jgi:putative Holliday junction resolvase